jgi:hypothetical protein
MKISANSIVWPVLNKWHIVSPQCVFHECSVVANEKCYKEQNLLSFIANKAINWHVMLKSIKKKKTFIYIFCSK